MQTRKASVLTEHGFNLSPHLLSPHPVHPLPQNTENSLFSLDQRQTELHPRVITLTMSLTENTDCLSLWPDLSSTESSSQLGPKSWISMSFFASPIFSKNPVRSVQAAAAAKSLQSCPTLCDPIDGSPPGSPVPGILQARTLEWVAISFSSV